MLLGLYAGEFAVFAADGAVALVFLFRGGEFGFDASDSAGDVLLVEFTFPDGDDGPGEGVEALGVKFIAGDVAGNLVFPEGCVGFWRDILGTAAVAVPETAVDEKYRPILWQYEIGRARQAFVIDTISKALMPEFASDDLLGSCVAGADARHTVMPL